LGNRNYLAEKHETLARKIADRLYELKSERAKDLELLLGSRP